MVTLEELEARVAALEASQADYRAVLAAVNALGANQRDQSLAIRDLTADVNELKSDVNELRTGVADVTSELRGFRRSTEEHLAELKDLVVGLRDS